MHVCYHHWPFWPFLTPRWSLAERFSRRSCHSTWQSLYLGRCSRVQDLKYRESSLLFLWNRSLGAEAQPSRFLVFTRNQLFFPLDELCTRRGPSLYPIQFQKWPWVCGSAVQITGMSSNQDRWSETKGPAQWKSSGCNMAGPLQEITSLRARLLEQFCLHVWCDARKSQQRHETQSVLIEKYNFIINENWITEENAYILAICWARWSILKIQQGSFLLIFEHVSCIHLASWLWLWPHLKQKAILHDI